MAATKPPASRWELATRGKPLINHEEHEEHEEMKLAAIKTDLLVKFNVTKLKDGVKRYVL